MAKAANDILVGRRIVAIRPMSESELAAEGWPTDDLVPAIVLDSGAVVFSSRDEEGNGPGALFGMTPRGDGFRVLAPQQA